MGMYGGGSAPSPDPNIGLAAIKSAEVGEQYLEWMKDQSEITNKWAADDRARWEDVYRPMQDEFIAEAKSWDTEGRRQGEMNQAVGDVRLAAQQAEGTRHRQAMAMGVSPDSGAFQQGERAAAQQTALAVAGASNMARRTVQQEAAAKKASAINMGSGLAVNPGTSMGLSNNALSSGANGAMQGYNQQGQLLNTQYNQQMQSYQANQQSSAALWQGVGTVGGMMMMSSKDSKENKRPMKEGEALEAIRGLPVERWDYKEGMGDGGKDHIGTYAEDFQKATGSGDGKAINVVDAIGLMMGGMKDLAAKVDKLGTARGLPERMSA